MGRSSPLRSSQRPLLKSLWYLFMCFMLAHTEALIVWLILRHERQSMHFFGSKDSRLNLLHHLPNHLLHVQCSLLPKASGLLDEKSNDFLSASNTVEDYIWIYWIRSLSVGSQEFLISSSSLTMFKQT